LTDGPVWLRHDYSKASLHTERIADMSAVILPPTTPVTWGDFSFVDVLLESLRAIEAREDYSWIVILSGQDYPIRPLADLERHLHELDADALLEQTADAHDPMRYSLGVTLAPTFTAIGITASRQSEGGRSSLAELSADSSGLVLHNPSSHSGSLDAKIARWLD